MINSYRYAFAASTSELPASGKAVDLGIGQVGVFDGKTYAATAGINAKSIFIAQGTPDTVFPQGIATGNQTLKTSTIVGKNLISLKRAKAQKAQGMITTMGFDGVDTTKNLTVKQGKSFTYWVSMYGSPIAQLLGDTPETHEAVYTEQFTVVLPCVDDCLDTCGDTFDPNIVADAAIDAFNTRKIIGGQMLSDWIKVSKLVSCTTPSGLPTVTYTKWTLTIPDGGDLAALGQVQSQYPGVDVTRTNRVGVYSTYEIVLADGEIPGAFSSVGNPVVPTCNTCPSGCPDGYSLTTALDVWEIARPISETTDLSDGAAQTAFAAAVEAAYAAQGAVDSVFLSFNGAVATVKIYFTAASTPANVAADELSKVGSNVAICTQDTPTTTNWVECTDCVKAEKTFVLTIKNTDCGGTYLTQLQAIYGDVTLVSTNADTCTSQYSLVVESDNKDCDACAEVKWEFTAPSPFEGLIWTEVAGENYGTDCNVGLKFESVYEQRQAKECFLKQVAYQFEPLVIVVSTRNPDPNDYSVLCDTDVPVTVVQNVKYPIGLGRIVADQVIASNYQFNKYWYKNPAERDAFSYELGIDLNGYYDQYVVEFSTSPAEAGAISGLGSSQPQIFETSVFYPQGTGGDFENVISAFAANFGVTLEDIII